NVVSKTNQEPPQDSNIHQLIEECSVEVHEEQKQKMEDTMFDLVKICHHKQFLCIHDDIDDLIESALDSKLLSINSQRLDKKEQEVKIVEEQLAERRNQYDQSTSTDRPIFLNGDEDHPVQNKESPENSSEETVVSKTNQKPPQDSDIHQLIEKCSIYVPEQQKQNMEKTMLDLVKNFHHK
nr:hypothetical protein [Tanacetum cinerariifolium]